MGVVILPASFVLFSFQLNCFACTAIYRFQLIFVRRKRKVVEYVPTTRNSIVTTSPVPIVRQTQQYQVQQPQQQHVVKVVTPKIVSVPVVKNNVKTVPMRNIVTYQQSPPQQANRVVIAQQQATKKEEDASRLRQMLEKRQQLQKQNAAAAAAAAPSITKRFVATKQQNIAQRIVYAQPKTVVTVPDIGSSEEDIETEVIDSSMVEVEMTSNSNSPLPAAVKQHNNRSKVVVQREPNVSVMDDSDKTMETSSSADANPLKCDLCNKEFHSLRQRERHRVTHTSKDSTSSTGRNKTLSLSEEGTSSPTHTSNKQSPNIVTKVTTTTVKRTGQALKRAKLSDPLEDVVMEVTTEDSEN